MIMKEQQNPGPSLQSDPAWSMRGLPDLGHVDLGSDCTSHHLEYSAVALKIRLSSSTVGRPSA